MVDRLSGFSLMERSSMAEKQWFTGDPIPPSCELIEIHVAELSHLFLSIDPSPLPDRDLDPNTEEFIVEWAREASREATLGLLVHLDGPAGLAEEAALIGDAIRGFFSRRALASRRELKQLFRRGRVSLVIGIFFLAVSIGTGELVKHAIGERHLGQILSESLLIGGWVAMWRPLEIFLYDWWPIRAKGRLFGRLSSMPVRIEDSHQAHHGSGKK
jgi:hypothetical protein